MAQTKSVHTLERARDAFVDIREALENKTGSSLDNVVVEDYDDIIANIPSGSGSVKYWSKLDDTTPYYFENVGKYKYESNNVGIDGSEAQSIFEVTVDEDCSYNLYYSVSSESNYDKLNVYLNDLNVLEISGEQKGFITLNLRSGLNRVIAKYSKDASASREDDKACVVLSPVSLEASLEVTNVTPSTFKQSISPVGYGISNVEVDAVENVRPEIIKMGEIILGVEGTLETGSAVLQSKTVRASQDAQYVNADAGYDGLETVTIEAVGSDIDSDIKPENIKKDVNILGVVGTLEAGAAPKFTDLSYFFFGGARSELSINDIMNNSVTTMKCMCQGGSVNGGTYDIDISNCVDENSLENAFGSARPNGVVNLNILFGKNNNHLYALMYDDVIVGDMDNYYNIAFYNDGSGETNIESLQSAFSGSTFGNIDFTGILGSTIKNIKYLLKNSSIINEIIGLEYLDLSECESMYEAFSGLNKRYGDTIPTISFSNTELTKCKDLMYAFSNCNVEKIDFGFNTIFSNTKFYHAFYVEFNMTSHLKYIDNLNINETTYNPDDSYGYEMAFSNRQLETVTTRLNKWTIHNSIKRIFYGCSKLKSIPAIDLYTYNTSALKSLSNAFADCEEIEEINITIHNNDNAVLEVDSMFSNCYKLKEIKGDLNLSCIYSAWSMPNLFFNCRALEKIYTTGGIAENTSKNLTLDLSYSPVFDIAHYIGQLATKVTTYERNIKVNATVYAGITQDTFDAAAAKGYTIISA